MASSGGKHLATPGLRWIVAALIIKLPWSARRWAWPFFSVPLTTPKVSAELKVKHHTLTQRTMQILKWLTHTFPDRAIKIIGDGAYSVIDLGLLAQKHNVTLIAPIRLAARLFAPASPRTPGTMGRPRKVGARLPLLRELATDLKQDWQLLEMDWYGGTKRPMYLLSGTAVWYSTLGAEAPLALRWVLIGDPKGQLETKAYFSTDQRQSAVSIGNDFVKRWNTLVTFEESRAHLGIETQRQWSDLAIERTTPVLFGLYSLTCLCAVRQGVAS